MSQEEQPFRTRRQIREARERATADAVGAAQVSPEEELPDSADATSGPASEAQEQLIQDVPRPEEQSGPVTARTRRVAGGPVDALPDRPERSSQLRARDRAALRTIKDLAAKEEQLSGGTPTRRQRRLQELAAETTQRPVVPPAQGSGTPGASGERPNMGVSVGPGALTEPLKVTSKDAGEPLPDGMSVEDALAARQQFTVQAQEYFAKLAENGGADAGAVDQEVLAEQIAMAERAAILNQRAQRKEELARDAEDAKSAKDGASTSSVPTQAHNLGSMARQETVQIPGVGHPVVRTPTTQVPYAVNVRPAASADGAPETARVQRVEAPAEGERPVKSGKSRKPGRRAQLLAQAEALAVADDGEELTTLDGGAPVEATDEPGGQAAPEQERGSEADAVVAAQPTAPPRPQKAPTAVPVPSPVAASAADGSRATTPVAARNAHGLDPLDAGTAGIQTANRLRLLHWGALGVGALALLIGVIMVITVGGGH
ncbi:hypothetical protein [Arthrobacter sp. NPDC090010]|uniref:hypothetical protein n=1 Tax=Arthrobacter sp. NPDC090010 TaxID=3363942 RepID=UPI0037F2B64B